MKLTFFCWGCDLLLIYRLTLPQKSSSTSFDWRFSFVRARSPSFCFVSGQLTDVLVFAIGPFTRVAYLRDLENLFLH